MVAPPFSVQSGPKLNLLFLLSANCCFEACTLPWCAVHCKPTSTSPTSGSQDLCRYMALRASGMRRLVLFLDDPGEAAPPEAVAPPSDNLRLLVRTCLAVLLGCLQAAAATVNMGIFFGSAFLGRSRSTPTNECSTFKAASELLPCLHQCWTSKHNLAMRLVCIFLEWVQQGASWQSKLAPSQRTLAD